MNYYPGVLDEEQEGYDPRLAAEWQNTREASCPVRVRMPRLEDVPQLVIDTPHASDCNVWVHESCDCVTAGGRRFRCAGR